MKAATFPIYHQLVHRCGIRFYLGAAFDTPTISRLSHVCINMINTRFNQANERSPVLNWRTVLG